MALTGVPRDSLQPCTLRKDEALWIETVGPDGTKAFEGLVNLVPEVIAGERDMAPGQRGDLGEELVGDVDALSLYEADSAAEIDGVPQDDGVDDEVEA